MTLYRVEVMDHMRPDGALLWHSTGELASVAGQEYVKLAHGTLVQRTADWKARRCEALAEAADQIEAKAALLSRQATRLREEAHAPA